jgi:hypothetical protein
MTIDARVHELNCILLLDYSILNNHHTFTLPEYGIINIRSVLPEVCTIRKQAL